MLRNDARKVFVVVDCCCLCLLVLLCQFTYCSVVTNYVSRRSSPGYETIAAKMNDLSACSCV